MDSVELELPHALFDKLARYSATHKRQIDALVEAILSDAMEPDEPTRKKVKLDCTKCGFTQHRWTRSTLIKGGEFAHLYGCSKCYRLRRYGTVAIKGWREPEDESPTPAPVKSTKPVRANHLWLVPYPTMPVAMVTGVPEAMQ